MRKLLHSKKGQGTTEYIVILAIVVAIAVTIVWHNLGGNNGVLSAKVGQITNKINEVGP